MDASSLRVLVAVGSRRDRVCSVGAFARAEAKALEAEFKGVEILEPDERDRYPVCKGVSRPDVIFFHAPALHDRSRPWRPFLSAGLLRAAFPKAKLLMIVHEFSEAPRHWQLRQLVLLRLADGVIVNSEPDYKGVRAWHARVFRSHLGPTLFMPEFLAGGEHAGDRKQLAQQIADTRAELGSKHSLDSSQKWVLHPGLLTPGKGINFLGKLAPMLRGDSRLLVMGGIGPKLKDRNFAKHELDSLRHVMAGRLSFIESPPDELFKRFLLASDLVVLPYDVGLSERRSSYLSAVCCGANVWTTSGNFTPALGAEGSGTHFVPVEHWRAGDQSTLCSVTAALEESADKKLERRLKNLAWASTRTWDRRVSELKNFISSI